MFKEGRPEPSVCRIDTSCCVVPVRHYQGWCSITHDTNAPRHPGSLHALLEGPGCSEGMFVIRSQTYLQNNQDPPVLHAVILGVLTVNALPAPVEAVAAAAAAAGTIELPSSLLSVQVTPCCRCNH